MIRRLTNQEIHTARAYLGREPLYNIYLIHALQVDGLESEHTTFWGAWADRPGDEPQEMQGMLAVDSHSRPSVGYMAGDSHEVLVDLGTHALQSKARVLTGRKAYVEPCATYVQETPSQVTDRQAQFNRARTYRYQTHTRRFFFYRADPDGLTRHFRHPVRVAVESDIPSMIELYRGYEFSRGNRTDQEIGDEIARAMAQSGTYFCHEQEGRIISAARVFPETAQAGMIGAARTLPEFRGQGIYLSVRTACFEHLFEQGKTGLGMFLDTNTSMHRVIEKQGGTILDEWLIVTLKTQPPLRRRVIPSPIRRWGTGLKHRVMHRTSNHRTDIVRPADAFCPPADQ
jgi:predicted GNAT family acetyltransferase